MQRDPVKIARARSLRRELSPPERIIWRMLRAHRLNGWKFTRQAEIGSYFLDFAARREKLAIEIDGESHADQVEYDAARTHYLEGQGWQVLRFTNGEVMTNTQGIATIIDDTLALLGGPSPQPSPRRGEGG